MEHQRARLESDLHEMSRPLARSKDDDKLESHLKGVERQEDPMLDYIRKKQKSREIKSGIPGKSALHITPMHILGDCSKAFGSG